jgi:hypothetical protein
MNKDNIYFIVFNGPPRSGKDTAVKLLTPYNNSIFSRVHILHEKFSKPMKQAISGWLGAEIDYIGNSPFDAEKDMTIKILNKSYRQAQIDLFDHMQDKYGPTILADFLWRRVITYNTFRKTDDKPLLVFISDGGKTVETNKLTDFISPDNLLTFHIRRMGCNFRSDNREYTFTTKGNHYTIENTNLEEYEQELKKAIHPFLSSVKLQGYYKP